MNKSAGLWTLYAFTVISIAGFATFGLHPELLVQLSPSSLEFYAISFRFFAIGQVFLAGLVLIGFLIQHAGFKWVPAFIVLYALSLGSELLGTSFGIPFGAYSYSDVLNPMWLDKVPVGIPLSWFYMAIPAYAFALHALPAKARATSHIAFASLVLLAWDLALDPAMSGATRYWEWGESGPYYGMPLLNLFGWYVTGIALMSALSLLRAERWLRPLSIRWLGWFYGANLLLPLGMTAAAGMWGAVAATLIVLSLTWALARALAPRRSDERMTSSALMTST
jgi:putative membrane protein